MDINTIAVREPNKFSEPVEVQAGTEFRIPITGKSIKVVFLGGSAESTITVKQGNGIQGVRDLAGKVPTGDLVGIKLDTGYFEAVKGENAGYIVAEASTSVTLIAVED